jgi:hypothetical protein
MNLSAVKYHAHKEAFSFFLLAAGPSFCSFQSKTLAPELLCSAVVSIRTLTVRCATENGFAAAAEEETCMVSETCEPTPKPRLRYSL